MRRHLTIIGGAILVRLGLRLALLMLYTGIWRPEVALCAAMRFTAIHVRYRTSGTSYRPLERVA